MRLVISTLLVISALSCAILRPSTAQAQTASARPMEFVYKPSNDMLYYDYRGNKTQFDRLSSTISSKRDSIKLGLLKFHIRGFVPSTDNTDEQLKLIRVRSSRLKSYIIQRFAIKEADFYSNNPALPNVSQLSADNMMTNVIELSLLPTGVMPSNTSYDNNQYTSPNYTSITTTLPSTATTTDVHRNISPFNKPSMLPPPTGGPAEYTPKTSTAAQSPEKPSNVPVPEPPRKPFSNELQPPSLNMDSPAKIKERIKKQKTTTTQEIYDTFYTQPEAKLTETRSTETVHPTWSVGTNLLYWLALSPNIEFQVMMGKHFSLSLEAQYSYLLLDAGNKRYHTWSVAPELRYWFRRSSFTGSSLGIYAAIGAFDLKLDDTGHQGDFIQAGLSYNYTLQLRPRTSLRFGLSAGYVRTKGAKYDSFQLPVYSYICDEYMQYIGITRAGISIVFQLGNKKGGVK